MKFLNMFGIPLLMMPNNTNYKTSKFKQYRDLQKSTSVQFGTHHTKKGPGRYSVKAKQDR